MAGAVTTETGMEDKKPFVKVESIGDSLLGAVLAICLAVALFHGEPSIAESLRVVAEKWAAGFGK